jgi:asparagine synthase (glutamine-hydrolysing)
MSGITGTFRLDGAPVSQEILHRMTAAMEHRGPDGSVCWAEGSLGFGHALFYTTPESLRESGPVVDQLAGLALV